MTKTAPRWLLWAGFVFLLWNLMGLWSFTANWQMSATGYATLPAVERELWSNMPGWTWVAFAIAVGCGTLGAVTVLLRRRIAVPLYVISLIAICAQFSWPIFMTDAYAKMGADLITFPIMLIVVAALQYAAASRWAAKGWLR